VRRLLTALLAGTLLTAPFLLGGPASAEDDTDFETREGKSEPVYTEFIDEEYRVPTDHGTIYGVVKRPVVPEGVKVPVILTYTPYNILARPVAAMVDQTDAVTTFFTPRGYARASFDLVGTRESSGCYDHGGIREKETGAAVVEFLGTQEWSNGKVGMIGGSYDGTTQWATAGQNPPHLTTIVPQVAIGRWYDYAFKDGVRYYSGNGTPALFDFGFGMIPPTGVTGGLDWFEALRDHLTPCERVEHNDKAFLPDPVYDEYWDARDYVVEADNITASALVVGSWRDYNVHALNSIEMWNALPDDYPKRLVMGQAGHSGTQVEDSEDLYHAWFDYWLMGLDTGAMDLPAVDSVPNKDLVNDEVRRFQDASWPPPQTVEVALGLGFGDTDRGALGLQDAETASWTDDNPALSDTDAIAGDGAGAAVLFLGAPLEKQVRISGTAVLEAEITTSEESTHLTPVLFEEDADGTRRWITKGLLNSRNRDGERVSETFAPGETWKARVTFQPVDWVLDEGSRLGLAVMSMNTSDALYPDTTMATNDLNVETARLIVPASRNAAALGDPLAAEPEVAPPPAIVAPRPRPTRPRPPAPPGTLPATGGGVLPVVAAPLSAALLALVARRRRTAS
jgi:X-Pro dipeptidyl-peptidase